MGEFGRDIYFNLLAILNNSCVQNGVLVTTSVIPTVEMRYSVQSRSFREVLIGQSGHHPEYFSGVEQYVNERAAYVQNGMFTHPFLINNIPPLKQKKNGKEKTLKPMDFLVTTVNFALCKNYSITQKFPVCLKRKIQKVVKEPHNVVCTFIHGHIWNYCY